MARSRQRLARLGALAGAALTLGACQFIEIEDAPMTALDPQGPFAQREDDLFWPVFWIATAVFILVQGAILVAVFLFRDKEGAKEARQLHGSPKLEVLWTVVPALILAGIAVPTTAAVFDLTECDPDAIQIDVIGHQWWFEYHYPDAEIWTANVMVIPAGQEICANLTSEDVIHNFWVPALNGKRYAIPGQVQLLRLQADEPGEYWGQCAEFCGLSHSLMRARVIAMSPADYETWIAGQQAPTPLPAEGSTGIRRLSGVHRAQRVYPVPHRSIRRRHSNIVPNDAFAGPELTHFASRSVFAGAVLPEEGQTKAEALKLWLANPPEVKPGSFMPDLALTEQEIDDLIVWLESTE